jgi:hypothetical protein
MLAPTIAMPPATAGRSHRVTRPSGNSRSTSAIGTGKNNGSSASPAQAATSGAGRDPGAAREPWYAYARSANSSTSAVPAT